MAKPSGGSDIVDSTTEYGPSGVMVRVRVGYPYYGNLLVKLTFSAARSHFAAGPTRSEARGEHNLD
jgi:hypothetical protein